MLIFNSEICQDFAQSGSREWLETNGIGGFACSTISGANIRRYNALLTPATNPPLGRITTVSKFEETLIIDGKRYELLSNQYPNKIYPEGFKYLKEFRLDPFPVWLYEVEGIEIEKKIFMIYGENSTVCQWSVVSGQWSEKDQRPKTKNQKPIFLELRPLLSFCDYHHLQHEDVNLDANFETSENTISVKPYASMPAIFFNHNAEEIIKTGFWYRNFEYAIEKERGFDFREDLFQPFALNFDLTENAVVILSTEKRDFNDAEKFEKAEIERRENLIKIAEANDDFSKNLVLAADQFIVSRGAGKTIIAGYPWFSDWGRDTMIALPGLTLATNRAEIAKQILLEFSLHISEGMIPNRFPDAGEIPEYNTVDATLWYFEAIRAYVEKTGDYDFVRESLYEKLVNVVEWHLRGTRFNIHVDTDGLLCAGEKPWQLTWMDAKIGDISFTPRMGKPVEIQALWFNALKIMQDFAEQFEDEENRKNYEATAEMAKHSFNALFWNEAENCLFDVVDNGEKDGAIRPNQIFAVSLKNAILTDEEKVRKVVETVENKLLTPVGLRSLSAENEQYCPIYIGSPFQRDSCYHQGTVWAWLIGGFVDAYRKVFPENEAKVEEILKGFESHLREAGIGQISEIFDADAPHNARGCFAQAWSVAEVLRVRVKS
ncbi:MAG TPA: amylo-alpha-1,6-glucosidase [Pyrinomonadaceae bacterium]|nr:amylo-alpha-1,6-glucosidase [Pyrinomonadaceae bacterium]